MRLTGGRRKRGTGALAALGEQVLAVAALGALLVAVGCSSTQSASSDGGASGSGLTGGSGGAAGTGSRGSVPKPAPTGPAATIAGPLTGGKGLFLGESSDPAPTLAAAGFQQDEFTAAGTATSYTSDGDLPTDGTWTLKPKDSADYVTRIVVRRPKDASKFNGTVAVEWLNVSGGVDAGPDFTYLSDELLRKGYAWVGVSAQRIGVEGGPVAVKAPGADEAGAGKGLKSIDPERYGKLQHPGDAYAYDMFTQVARALRSPGATDPLGGLDVQKVLAVGESQSAFTLTTYYDGVQPLTKAFDGFFIHSRGGSAAPLESPNGYIDIAGSLTGKPTKLRTDSPTPAIVIETETDVLGLIGYYPARQPDADKLRFWEVAGTAHADAVQIGDREASLGCPAPVNRGQQVFVLRAALRHLDEWVGGGAAPPHGAQLQVDTSGTKPTYVVDDVGNVKGGVRTPVVDAPVDKLSGLAPDGASVICILFGSTTPLPADQLAKLYSSRDAYVQQYAKATDAAIAAGFALADDRQHMIDGSAPDRVGT